MKNRFIPLHSDQAVMWCIPHLQTLQLMRAVYVNHAFKPHAHDYYVIGMIEKGVQKFSHGRQNLVTTPEYLIIINPGEIHTGEAAIPEGFTYRSLYPRVELFNQVARELNHNSMPLFSEVLVHDPYLYNRFKYLHVVSEQAASALELEEQFTYFFIELVRRYAAEKRQTPIYTSARREVKQVQAYLHTHYREDVTLSELSHLVHISPYHLARLFQRQIGIPPHQYLENVRIEHARQLLSAGVSIAQAAYATGFSSQSHLNRTFKRFMGITPGKFVQQRKIV